MADGELHSGAVECDTNNQIGLYAVLKALEHVNTYTHVTVVMDHKLVVGWLSQNSKFRNPATREIVTAGKVTREDKCLDLEFRKVSDHIAPGHHLKLRKAARKETKITRQTLAQ